MRIRLGELDVRQVVLGGVALLLIIAHMGWPGAGVDAVSLILLGFLTIVLYGDEATGWLARRREENQHRHASNADQGAELSGRVRDLAYQTEHARVATAVEGIDGIRPSAPAMDAILERAGGEPRSALLLLGAALEDRLRSAGEAPDGLTSVRRLAERGRVTPQFADAYAAFRSLRNEVARSGDTGVTDAVRWSLIDTGAALLALVPEPRREASWSPEGQGVSE